MTRSDDASTSDDEQVALDLQAQEDVQLAMELQAQELASQGQQQQQEQQRQQQQQREPNSTFGHDMQQQAAQNMLYVPCEMDGTFVQLFVDCGAATSCISTCMVKRLGLQPKVNPAVQGTAVGAGSAAIVGMLENVACTIGHVEFRLCFLVLETPLPTLLLGLDQLRRFKCVIDLDENTLTFGGKDGVSVEFLSAELAAQASAESFTSLSQSPSAGRRGAGLPSFLRPFLG